MPAALHEVSTAGPATPVPAPHLADLVVRTTKAVWRNAPAEARETLPPGSRIAIQANSPLLRSDFAQSTVRTAISRTVSSAATESRGVIPDPVRVYRALITSI
jgi:hypothetical protein